MQCNIARIPTHNFNNEESIMRISSIPDFINGFHCSIHCCIKSNGEISSGNVFINSSRETNARDIIFRRKNIGSSERSVAANYHQSIYAEGLEVLICFLSSLGFEEIFTASCFQNSSSTLNDIGYGTGMHRNYVV